MDDQTDNEPIFNSLTLADQRIGESIIHVKAALISLPTDTQNVDSIDKLINILKDLIHIRQSVRLITKFNYYSGLRILNDKT